MGYRARILVVAVAHRMDFVPFFRPGLIGNARFASRPNVLGAIRAKGANPQPQTVRAIIG